jgi:hypothetical protein
MNIYNRPITLKSIDEFPLSTFNHFSKPSNLFDISYINDNEEGITIFFIKILKQLILWFINLRYFLFLSRHYNIPY